MGYYIIKDVSDAYTLQEDTKCNGKIGTASKLVVKAQYLSCMKENMKWYWKAIKKDHSCHDMHNYASMSRYFCI